MYKQINKSWLPQEPSNRDFPSKKDQQLVRWAKTKKDQQQQQKIINQNENFDLHQRPHSEETKVLSPYRRCCIQYSNASSTPINGKQMHTAKWFGIWTLKPSAERSTTGCCSNHYPFPQKIKHFIIFYFYIMELLQLRLSFCNKVIWPQEWRNKNGCWYLKSLHA